eukprot:TRINITY_DN21266_c0_g1_i1.p1 TRINITY_DN21266_c0_g1~~TRINITY_DN21266_c0_g1_i1.p1  ORF type:complete len:857 (+),score=298.68 TRINITY_DN21266_c0_g1_i1:72-2642(+)
MSYLMRVLGATDGGGGGRSARAASLALQRLQEATSIADRRDALKGIVDLGSDQDYLDPEVVTVLMTLLRKEWDDADTRDSVLGCLVELFVTERVKRGRFLDAFAHSPSASQYVATLLMILRTGPFHPKNNVIEILTFLLEHAPGPLQRVLLKQQEGVAAVVGIVSDGGGGGILRCKGLLLIKALVAADEEVQKIVAFQEVFPALLQVVEDEGGVEEGGIAVDDVLDIMQSLLSANTPNQKLFRETVGMARLGCLVDCCSQEGAHCSDATAARVARAVVLIRHMASAGGQQAEADATCRAVAGLSGPPGGLLRSLAATALRGAVDASVRCEVLRTMHSVVAGGGPSAAAVAGALYSMQMPAGGTCADALAAAITGPDTHEQVRSGAAEVIHAAARASPDVAMQLAMAAAAAPPTVGRSSAATSLLAAAAALPDSGNQAAVAAAAHAIVPVTLDSTARDLLVAGRGGAFGSSNAVAAATAGAKEAVRRRLDESVQRTLLALLLRLVNGCAAAAVDFLRCAGAVPFFVAVAHSPDDAASARALSCCVVAAARFSYPSEQPPSDVSEDVPRDALRRGIDLTTFQKSVEGFSGAKDLQALVAEVWGQVQATALTDTARPAADDACPEAVQQLRELVRTHEAEKAALSARLEEMAAAAEVAPHATPQVSLEQQQLSDELRIAQSNLQRLLSDNEALQKQSADSERRLSDVVAQAERTKRMAADDIVTLDGRVKELEAENRRVMGSLSGAREQAQRVESQLEGVSAILHADPSLQSRFADLGGMKHLKDVRRVADAPASEVASEHGAVQGPTHDDCSVERLRRQLKAMEADQADLFMLLGQYDERLRAAQARVCADATPSAAH